MDQIGTAANSVITQANVVTEASDLVLKEEINKLRKMIADYERQLLSKAKMKFPFGE